MTTLELGHEQQAPEPDRRLVAGRYRLHERIGSGRLGDIYAADDDGYRELGVGGRVAVQLLPDRIALDQGLFSKLKLGYTVLSAGSHPNIVPYLDCDHDGKFGYLVMQLLDGASLRFVLDDVTTLPLDEALPVIRSIGDALQFLHAKSMVHGQLNSENVFITDDLEIRLLDIVPLDSASTILRGVATRNPFGRADTADDIYALACLAYEILAGKHPFNFHPPSEASAAGLEPARIDSLPERQWNAIRRGLSFDREHRPATIREFLGDLGLTGTERLRPSETATTDRDVPAETVHYEAPPARSRPQPSPHGARTAPAESAVVTRPVLRESSRRETARAKRKRASRVRSLLLLPVLAAITAWYVYGQPRDDIAILAARVESFLVPAPAPVAPAASVAAAAVEADAAEPPAQEQAVAPIEPTQQPAAGPDTDAESIPAPVDPGSEPGPVAESETQEDIQEDVRDETSSTTVAEDAASGTTLVQSRVSVSERDGAARIAFRRPVDSGGTVVWWTADDSAIADSDYIALEQPVAAFTAGEEAETLHVPLINDGLPEAAETFFVYLGQRDPDTGRLEPIARVRVDVSDDD